MNTDNEKDSGAGELVATSEPLSAVAQLRIDLDAFDELFPTVSPYASKAAWERFTVAQDKIYADVDGNLHMLFDHIDAQAAEIKRLQGDLEAAKVLAAAVEVGMRKFPNKPHLRDFATASEYDSMYEDWSAKQSIIDAWYLYNRGQS